MTAKQKKNLFRILLSAALIIALHFVPVTGWPRFLLYMIPYLIIGYDILIKAFKGLVNRQPFDECFLMAVATIGAIALGLVKSGDYTEAVAVMLFYQIGEWFQSYAVGKSRRSISDLMDIRPDYANIESGNGELTQVDPDDVEIGTTIVVQPGEKVPIDGVVLQGTSSLDTAALTGESMPRDVAAGDEVISGCINLSGLLKIRTTKEFEESTASKILELIEDAGSRKSKSEDFITKFARIYTPAVVYAAIALAVLPPLLLLALGMDPAWGTWAYRALTFLVVSCPCALVISIPLSFFAGIGGASKEGILVVTAVHPERLDQKELLHMAAHVERYSTHPIAAALREAYPDEKDGCSVEDVTEIAGRGIRAKVSGKTVCVGNARMMDDIGAKWKPCEQSGTIIHVAIDGEYEGHIVISDVIKEHSAQAIRELKKNGVTKTVMLTGDAKAAADQVASKLSVDEVHAELLPADKVAKVEELIASKKSPKDKVAFVGDGINDAPVLARADIGIAMGAMGSDAAIEAADIVLMDDDPLRIVTAIRISRKCLRIVRENIWFAIGVKLLCLLLTAVGIGNMWLAIFADVGVMIIAVLNAVRCLHAAK